MKIFEKNNRKNTLLIIIGVIAILLGLGLLIFQSNIMGYIAELAMQLKPDSHLFTYWQKLPFEVPTIYTFFNWTNSESFFNKSIKPRFEEVGPYQYQQTTERVDIVWNDNDTITYKQIRSFRYDDEIPNNGNLNDEIITINYISASVPHMIRFWNVTFKDIFAEYLWSKDPYYYLKTTADEEILEGKYNLLTELGNYFAIVRPDIPRFDHFGWLRMKNGDSSFDGVFNMATGTNRKFDVLNWNYYSTTPYFNKSCAKVRGDAGDLFSVPETKEFIYVFVSFLCRYVKLYFEKEIKIDGILGYKYSLTERSIDNGTLEPENSCFCGGDCVPSGLVNVTPCMYGFNGFASLPHFYNADPVYINAVEGLNPEKSKHETYIVLEPTSMILLDFKLRIQGNLFTHSVKDISFFDNFPELFFPLFWLEQQWKVPKHIKYYLKIYLKVPIVLYSAGVILIVFGLYLTVKFSRLYSINSKQKKSSSTLEDDQKYQIESLIN